MKKTTEKVLWVCGVLVFLFLVWGFNYILEEELREEILYEGYRTKVLIEEMNSCAIDCKLRNMTYYGVEKGRVDNCWCEDSLEGSIKPFSLNPRIEVLKELLNEYYLEKSEK